MDETQTLERRPASNPLSADVAVVGGGPTGMIAAIGAAAAGWSTVLIAPERKPDPRTTALLMPAIHMLQGLEVWDDVEPQSAPLVTMRIVDDTGRIPRAPEIAFDAHEVNLDQFGYNIPNDALNAALAERLEQKGVQMLTAPATAFVEGEHAQVETEAGAVEAGLVVAADGSRSLIREAAGIAVRQWRYEQAAFVTTLTHQRPHGNASTEFHTPTGPFTLVPLPGERSSLVWVVRPEEAERLAARDPGPLAQEIERAAHSILGRMRVDGPRGVIPMESLIAHSFGKGRAVLVGEAGHRFPPIGAQGLNLGARDCAVLRELLVDAKRRGDLTGLAQRYDRKRRLDVGVRTAGVDLLNRSLLTDAFPVAAGRTLALTAARTLPGVRRTMMRFGLGTG